MLNEILRLSALALIASLLAFAGLVSSQTAFVQSCQNDLIENNPDLALCEQGLAKGEAPSLS